MTSTAIPVFFSHRQSVPGRTHFSPSAGKPAIVAEALQAMGYPVEIRASRGLLFWELAKVHDPAYVTAVLTGKKANGFGDTDRRVARSLPYTSGSMLAAAEAATPDMPAVSLSSGFHHAGWDHGSGFCTFNGLVATTWSLLARRVARRVAILDCDAHYGNGTDEILDRLSVDAPSTSHAWGHGRRSSSVYLLPVGKVIHCTMGSTGARGQEYLRKLAEFLHAIVAFRPDVIIFQAGADPHECDPLGGYISTEEMEARDRMVFTTAKKAGIPVAWNLAGGYQKGGKTGIDPVLALHLNTFREACRVYGLPVPDGLKVEGTFPKHDWKNDARW